MDSAPPKQPLTVKLAPDVRAQLDRLASRQDRSRSWITAEAIKAYAARHAEPEAPK